MPKVHDLTGRTFDKLTAIEPTKERKNGSIVWKCECECSNICYVSSYNLLHSKTKSCGCLYVGNIMNDLAERTFDKLTAIEPTNKRDINGNVIWKCECECGNICYVTSDHLNSGNTKSCGCLRSKDLTKRTFDKLTVKEKTNERYYGSVVWKCECECGNICYVSSYNLLHSKTKSCGCL